MLILDTLHQDFILIKTIINFKFLQITYNYISNISLNPFADKSKVSHQT